MVQAAAPAVPHIRSLRSLSKPPDCHHRRDSRLYRSQLGQLDLLETRFVLGLEQLPEQKLTLYVFTLTTENDINT